MAAQSPIKVLAFGSAAEVLGWPERSIEHADGMTLADVIEELEGDCPRMIEGRGRLKFAINEKYATADAPIQPGDEIAIIPPVAGGEGTAPVECRLVRELIDAAALAAEVERESFGAILRFDGVVRAEINAAGAPLKALEYTAYEPMALAEMRRIAGDVRERFDVGVVRLVHRLGVLEIGEASVVIVVSSGHRAEAFDACRAIIEELKVSVPIFKREIWQDGSQSWVEGTPPADQ